MNVLIIDDEVLSAQLLEDKISMHCPNIKEVTTFISPHDGLEALRHTVYDILFLDVEMPEMNCFDFLEKAELPSRTSVIIVTAYSNYAVEAFKAKALHYLLKPVDAEELVEAVKRAQLSISPLTQQKESKTITIYNKDRYLILKKKEIVRLEADGSYTTIFLKNGKKLMASKRVGYFESHLESPPFVRCHNSHLVNINFIISIDNGRSGFIRLEDNSEIPVSHFYKPKFKALLDL